MFFINGSRARVARKDPGATGGERVLLYIVFGVEQFWLRFRVRRIIKHREAVKADLMAMTQRAPEASRSRDAICQFWKEHRPANGANAISRSVSLALELSNPPAFTTEIPETDLPADAAYVLGIVPLLRTYYRAAEIHRLWQKNQGSYESLVKQLPDPVSALINQTDIFLKLPFANYPGQRFAVYLEPQLSPAVTRREITDAMTPAVYSPDKQGKDPQQ